MMNAQQRSEVPVWAVGLTIVVALVVIVLAGLHFLNPKAPNSDLKMPTSYHYPQRMPPAGANHQ